MKRARSPSAERRVRARARSALEHIVFEDALAPIRAALAAHLVGDDARVALAEALGIDRSASLTVGADDALVPRRRHRRFVDEAIDTLASVPDARPSDEYFAFVERYSRVHAHDALVALGDGTPALADYVRRVRPLELDAALRTYDNGTEALWRTILSNASTRASVEWIDRHMPSAQLWRLPRTLVRTGCEFDLLCVLLGDDWLDLGDEPARQRYAIEYPASCIFQLDMLEAAITSFNARLVDAIWIRLSSSARGKIACAQRDALAWDAVWHGLVRGNMDAIHNQSRRLDAASFARTLAFVAERFGEPEYGAVELRWLHDVCHSATIRAAFCRALELLRVGACVREFFDALPR